MMKPTTRKRSAGRTEVVLVVAAVAVEAFFAAHAPPPQLPLTEAKSVQDEPLHTGGRGLTLRKRVHDVDFLDEPTLDESIEEEGIVASDGGVGLKKPVRPTLRPPGGPTRPFRPVKHQQQPVSGREGTSSCVGSCNGNAGDCYCDGQCDFYNDCCDDACQVCACDVCGNQEGECSIPDLCLDGDGYCGTPPSPPDAPTNLAAALSSDPQVTVELTWSAASGGDPATGFVVHRRAEAGSLVEIGQVSDGTTMTYDDVGTLEAGTYHYAVQATNYGGESGFSDEASVTVPSCQALELSTGFGCGGGGFTCENTEREGFMFDVETEGLSLSVNAFYLNIEKAAPQVQVWTREGTHEDSMDSASGWTQIGSTYTLDGQGEGQETLLTLSESVPINGRHSFYFFQTNDDDINLYYDSSWTLNSVQASDDNLKIYVGTRKNNQNGPTDNGPAFNPSFDFQRGYGFSGTIIYTVCDGSSLTSPSNDPSSSPSLQPSLSPSRERSEAPTKSELPSLPPSHSPSDLPSSLHSQAPSESTVPSSSPSWGPSTDPSSTMSNSPSHDPSSFPSSIPSNSPSAFRSQAPSESTLPSSSPSSNPSSNPSSVPSDPPSSVPSYFSSSGPSDVPSTTPSGTPSESTMPSDEPSSEPSGGPSSEPSDRPGPNRPEDLTATPVVDENRVDLAWNPPSGGPDPISYEVHRRIDGQEYDLTGEPLATVDNSITSYSDTDLPAEAVTYHYAVRSVNAAGESGLSDEATVAWVPPAPACTDQVAEFDGGYGVPACTETGCSCDSGPDLLLGRHTYGPEPNRPNTLDGCQDGTSGDSGSFHSDESMDRVVVRSTNGDFIRAASTVEVVATVWAWNTYTADFADFFHSEDVENPTWVLIGTVPATQTDGHDLTTEFTLPEGDGSSTITTLQAIRVQFRYNGSPEPCTSGGYSERDDLIFAVAAPEAECTTEGDCPEGSVCESGGICSSSMPSSSPSSEPSASPSDDPTNRPSSVPSVTASVTPSGSPSSPTAKPSVLPSGSPSTSPTKAPVEIISVPPTTYQAEVDTIMSGVSIENDRATQPTGQGGFTGEGYIDFGNAGSYMEWDNINVPITGTYELQIRYAVGDSSGRKSNLTVNGDFIDVMPFSYTVGGSYEGWDFFTYAPSVEVDLNDGDNTIRIQSIGDGPNIDLMDVDFVQTAMPTVSPAPTPDLTYRPGDFDNGLTEANLKLSAGLRAEVVAEKNEPVQYEGGGDSTIDFHSAADGAAVIEDPAGTGDYAYVSNSEINNAGGGVGSIIFDSDGNVKEYKWLLSGTTRNCSGGKTPWHTWLSCEEYSGGRIWEVDPFGVARWGSATYQVTGMHRKSDRNERTAAFESVACDNRNPGAPIFYCTIDEGDGELRRFKPDSGVMGSAISSGDYTDVLSDSNNGTVDYLILDGSSTSGTFRWTNTRSSGQSSADSKFPNCEGIEFNEKSATLYFVSKKEKRLFALDMSSSTDSGSWSSVDTNQTLSGEPDQIKLICLDNDEGMLYFAEDGGDCGIYAKNENSDFVEIIKTTLSSNDDCPQGETTGVAFSPDHKFLFFATQGWSRIYKVWRDDGYKFSGDSLTESSRYAALEKTQLRASKGGTTTTPLGRHKFTYGEGYEITPDSGGSRSKSADERDRERKHPNQNEYIR